MDTQKRLQASIPVWICASTIDGAAHNCMKVVIKPVVFVVCLSPALWLFYCVVLAATGGDNLLGPDPAQYLALETGTWAIRMLIGALALTPLRFLFGAPYLWKFRRMLGLFALFYVSLHFVVFLAFLLQWQWQELSREITERPYITVGFLAFILLLPLGITSVQVAQRKLGRRWKQLHQLVYVINILAVLHVTWIVRSSIADALLYAVLVGLLLGYRLLRRLSPKIRKFSLRQAS
jgi:sulfoxide reductase heme-binding subunit YedZ